MCTALNSTSIASLPATDSFGRPSHSSSSSLVGSGRKYRGRNLQTVSLPYATSEWSDALFARLFALVRLDALSLFDRLLCLGGVVVLFGVQRLGHLLPDLLRLELVLQRDGRDVLGDHEQRQEIDQRLWCLWQS